MSILVVLGTRSGCLLDILKLNLNHRTMSAFDGYSKVPREEMKSFIERCMAKIGTPKAHGEVLADLLVSADYRGHYSHGLNRLEMYIKDVKSGTTSISESNPVIEKETVSTALVDGQNLLGPVVGKFCIDLAMEKAKTTGIGWVTARDSNHFGIAGWYSMRACEQGMIGMAFTNTSPLVVPTRAKQASLGTNPISVAAPANNGDSFVLDMATSTVALGKVEMNQRKNMPIPDGWGVDNTGKQTNDPAQVLSDGALMPLGGSEECGGYKGSGLAMMVEVFCGILGGSNFGPFIRSWKTSDSVAHLGQCFVAIDPNAFQSGFTDRMSGLIDYTRKMDPIEGESEVLVAGDPERKHMTLCDSGGGIPYHPNQIANSNEIAKMLDVTPVKVS